MIHIQQALSDLALAGVPSVLQVIPFDNDEGYFAALRDVEAADPHVVASGPTIVDALNALDALLLRDRLHAD